MHTGSFFTLLQNKRSVLLVILAAIYSVSMNVLASVSLEITIKADHNALDATSALLAGEQGSLLVLDNERAILSKYVNQTVTHHDLSKKKVFAATDVRGLTKIDADRYVIANYDDDEIAIIDSAGNLLQKFGESGSAHGQLDKPAGIDWSHNSRLYVADKGNDRISVFGLDGVFIKVLGQHGLKEKQRLVEPVQVYVDLQERIYVLEKRNRGIVTIFSHDGKLLQRINNKDFNQLANGDTEIINITIDDKGLLYAADKENGRILQIDWLTKKLISSFGSKGEQRGQFETVSAMATLPGNKIAIADIDNKKIEIYRLPGNNIKPLEKFYLPTVAYERSIKLNCTVAYRLRGGNVLCLDSKNDKVSTYKSSGKKVIDFKGDFSDLNAAAIDDQDVVLLDDEKLKFYKLDGRMRFEVGRSGKAPGKFDSPEGLFLTKDKVYVADTGNARIQIFSRDGIYLDKIANPQDSENVIFQEPVRVVIDNSNNMFVLDSGTKQVLVFDPVRKLLYRIGGKKGQPDAYVELYDIAVDADSNLYVLAATEDNETTIQVFSGPTQVVSFGAQVDSRVGLNEPVSISIPPANKTIVSVYDKELQAVKNYKFKQLPSKPGGLKVRGGIKNIQLSWNKVPGSYTSRYKVYGSREKQGTYTYITDVSGITATIENKGASTPRFYRISAISGFSVESEPSNIREDVFQTGYARYIEGNYKQAQTILTASYKEDKLHGGVIKYLGLTALALNDTPTALAYFTELSLIEGFKIEANNLQIKALVENREYVAAKAVVDRLIASETASIDTIVYCGELSLDLGDAIGAIDCLEEAIKQDKNNIKAHFLLGKAYIKLGLVDKGIAEFTVAENIAPNDAIVWYQSGLAYQSLSSASNSRHLEAIERFKKSLAIDVKNNRTKNDKTQLAIAKSYLAQKDYANVKNIAIKLAGKRDTETEGHYLLGITAYATGDFPQALLSLSKSTRADKSNSTAWLALADTYLQMNQESKVKSALEKAVEGDSKSFAAAYRLGALELEDSDYEKAAVNLFNASLLKPDDFVAKLQLSQALLKAKAYNKAAGSAASAAKLEPKNIDVLVLQAEIFNKQGKNGKAIDYLKQAMAKQKNSAKLNTRLGAIYVENGVFGAAQSTLDKAILLDKTSAEPHVLMATMYLARRAYDEAIISLDKAIVLDPSVENKLALDTAYAEKKSAIEFDKNAPKVIIKDLALDRVFSAAYKQYINNPIGKVTIENGGDLDYKDLKLRFSIKDYMDFPYTLDIPLLKANGSVVLELNAIFNNRILDIDEDTGVQVEVAVNFARHNKNDAIRMTKPMTIYGKNAIVWKDLNMIGAFVTPKDDLLRDFVRQSLNENKVKADAVDRSLLTAMTLFDIYGAHGINYVADPNSPYSEVTESTVDYVQFSRETLKLKSGDCDDLSVLLSASLENLGIETAIIDVPGHLLMMFNTGLSENERHLISLDDDLLIIRDAEVWIPIEATMIGQSFSEAWAEGASKYHKFNKENKVNVVLLGDAWKKFKPVTLKPAPYSIAMPETLRVQSMVQRETEILLEKSLDRLVTPYRALVSMDEDNVRARLQVAIIYAKYGLYDAANREFDEILTFDADNSAVFNNRGNIYFTQKDYERAIENYSYAEKLSANDAGIKMNISMANYQLGNLSFASNKYEEATMVDESVTSRFSGYIKLLSK
ncbi:MAG: tetratricopeptide repeat protein [Gammaproteobacteria bacterium]|nr:tetratricopeptide repeat protein [Gammaproteobacteria bacterium]